MNTPKYGGWEHAVRGMRNPLNSWDKSDSCIKIDCNECGIDWDECHPNDRDCTPHEHYTIGYSDLDLMRRLIRTGSSHRKFLRQIFVSVDITAPRYWWTEFDTYKVGTTANSCSTMHKITAKEFTFDDFSHEKLINSACMEIQEQHIRISPIQALSTTIECLNSYRDLYLQTKDKKYWWQLIQLLPYSHSHTTRSARSP